MVASSHDGLRIGGVHAIARLGDEGKLQRKRSVAAFELARIVGGECNAGAEVNSFPSGGGAFEE